MIQFHGRFKILKVDVEGYERELDVAFKNLYKKAMLVFLHYAMEAIPIQTGMARGALEPMARWLNSQVELIGATPTGRRNASVGAQNGIFELEEWQFPYYKFRVAVEVMNGWWWDQHMTLFNVAAGKFVTAGPWNAFEKGQQAFKDFIRANLKSSLPDIERHYTWTQVSF